jgi:Putative addiction module component
MTLQTIEKELLKLDANSRAKIASALLSSLDEPSIEETEKLWAEEANHRYNDLAKGRAKIKPIANVLKNARMRLK